MGEPAKDLSLERRAKDFDRAYMRNSISPLVSPQLDEPGHNELVGMLSESGYSANIFKDSRFHVRASKNGFDVFVEYDLIAKKPGFSYIKIRDYHQFDEFKENYHARMFKQKSERLGWKSAAFGAGAGLLFDLACYAAGFVEPMLYIMMPSVMGGLFGICGRETSKARAKERVEWADDAFKKRYTTDNKDEPTKIIDLYTVTGRLAVLRALGQERLLKSRK